MLAEYLVACDQSFDEVDKPEFRRLLEYTHLRSSLHIPHRTATRNRIMKMGDDSIEGVKSMIKVRKLSRKQFLLLMIPFEQELDCKISLSQSLPLSCTGSTTAGSLVSDIRHIIGLAHKYYTEELLIDFRELVGEHSGRNLAHAVYETLELYGLKDRVRESVIKSLL